MDRGGGEDRDRPNDMRLSLSGPLHCKGERKMTQLRKVGSLLRIYAAPHRDTTSVFFAGECSIDEESGSRRNHSHHRRGTNYDQLRPRIRSEPKATLLDQYTMSKTPRGPWNTPEGYTRGHTNG